MVESLGKGVVATGAGIGAILLTAVLIGSGCNGHVFEVMQAGSLGSTVACTCAAVGLVGIGSTIYGIRKLQDAWDEHKNTLRAFSVRLGWGGNQ